MDHRREPVTPGLSAVATGDRVSAQIVEWLHHASIEVAHLNSGAIEALRAQFDPGTDVYVNFLPKGKASSSVETARALARAGFNPVPHIAARATTDRRALDDFVAHLVGEAGVERVLVIAGDLSSPRGAFGSSLEILQTGVCEAHGIKAVGVAGHPEGHPAAGQAALDAALLAKRDDCHDRGLGFFIVTQFSFEAVSVLAYLDHLADLGIDAPVRIGLAGPATVATLVRFGLRCGIGASLKALGMRTQTVGRLIGDCGPEAILRELACRLADRPDPADIGVHFYPFGGIAKTSDWIASTLSLLYEQIARGAEAAR